MFGFIPLERHYHDLHLTRLCAVTTHYLPALTQPLSLLPTPPQEQKKRLKWNLVYLCPSVNTLPGRLNIWRIKKKWWKWINYRGHFPLAAQGTRRRTERFTSSPTAPSICHVTPTVHSQRAAAPPAHRARGQIRDTWLGTGCSETLRKKTKGEG